jgi:hypothetical protein
LHAQMRAAADQSGTKIKESTGLVLGEPAYWSKKPCVSPCQVLF